MTEQDLTGVSQGPETAPSDLAQPSVGQRLRAAREAARLSVADIAQSLKFSARQVEMIEADNYDALPGNTVVRGFTRSYARLLKLDADELLHMLDARTPLAPADVRPPDNMGVAADAATAERQFTPVLSATIVVAIAAVLLGAWHLWGPQTATVPGPASLSVKPPGAETPVRADAPPVPPPDTASAGGTVSAVAAESVPASGDSTEAGGGLLFQFEERSWLEVGDATRRMIFTGENQGGTRLRLTGTPPFDIVVGNATKVRLTYGGRAIDLAPHTRADVARFRLE